MTFAYISLFNEVSCRMLSSHFFITYFLFSFGAQIPDYILIGGKLKQKKYFRNKNPNLIGPITTLNITEFYAL